MIKNLLDVIDSDFFARVISRKVLVRIADFITLTRRYNNSEITDRALKNNLKSKLNELDQEFTSLLKLQRDKFSAHFQDLDFGERIDSWSNITYEHIRFFHEKINEIYTLLQSQSDLLAIEINQFLLSMEEIEKLQTIVKQKDIEDVPRVGSDILSLTRLNTSGIIPCHTIQHKVLALNSINIMLDFEIAIFRALDNYHCKSILKTLIINDMISFIDNIITRENSEYSALDKIIEKQIYPWKKIESFSIIRPMDSCIKSYKKFDFKSDEVIRDAQKILDDFLESFNIDSISEIRNCRNKIGSHIDKTEDFGNLINLLNNIDVEKSIRIYNNFLNIFLKICNSTFYLKYLTMPPTKMHGVLSLSNKPSKTFFQNPYVATELIKDDINDPKSYQKQLDELFKHRNYEDTRFFFYDALAHSEKIKSVTLDNKALELGKAHQFFIDKLNSGISIEKKSEILNLLSDCANGYPEQLIYILLETYKTNKLTNLKYQYIFCFGEIGHKSSNSVKLFLAQVLNDRHFDIIYNTLLSLLKIDIKSRGIDCVNKKLVINENEYSEIIKEQMNKFSPFYKLIVSILLSSEMLFTPMLGNYFKFFKSLYFDYFENIFYESIDLLDVELSIHDIEKLKISKQSNYLSVIFIIIAEQLKNQNDANFLYGLIANHNLKLNFQHQPFIEHLAYSNYKIGNVNKAVEIYKDLVEKNPEIVEYRIELLNYYWEQKNTDACISEINYLESLFNLNNEQIEKIQEIKSLVHTNVF